MNTFRVTQRLRLNAGHGFRIVLGLLLGVALWFGQSVTPADAAETVPSIDVTTSEPRIARDDDPRQFIEFVHEEDAGCQTRDGKKILVRSTHASRHIRVWLDRYYQNVGTGDRSRSDLAPDGEPEPLGCDTVMSGQQDWRIARALFLD